MWNILKFELRYRIRRPATWAYFGILLLLGFLIAANGGNGGAEKAYANSAAGIVSFMAVVSIFSTLIASAVMGVPVYRDIEHGVKNYYFTYPVSEKEYLLGRFIGSFLILLLISLGLVVGMLIGFGLGPLLGWEEAERFGPLSLAPYVHGLVFYFWPNMFFTGAIFFTLVALTRKVFVSYVGSVLFFIGYLVAITLTQDLDNQAVASVLDPFGLSAWTEASKYWTPLEQNTAIAPIAGNLLWNRLLWTGVGLALFLFVLFRFDFVRFLGGSNKPVRADSDAGESGAVAGAKIPQVAQSFGTGVAVRQMFAQAWIEFKSILRDPYFLAIMVGALLFLFLDGWFGNTTYGTPSLPTTYNMIEAKNGTYILFVMIVLVFYTGEVVHRDRTMKFDQIADALPVPNWVIFGGKFLTMVGVSFLLATLVWVVGVFSQTIQGYTDYDFGQYFTDLYLLTWPLYLVLVILAFFVHVVVNKKFLGHVVAIGLYAALLFVPGLLDIDYNMFLFGSRPGYAISDMNGFGHFITGVTTFNIYWIAFGIMLLVGALLLWARGTDDAWKSRFQLARQRVNWRPLAVLGGAAVVFALTGFTIYHNVSVRNSYQNDETSQDESERYEREYRRYLELDQPKLTAVDYRVDLVPEERRATAVGTFQIRNRSNSVIDTILLTGQYSKPSFTLHRFTIGGRSPALVKADMNGSLGIYTLDRPLRPGDSTEMVMEVELNYTGFPNEGYQRDIVANGTFLNSGIFPSFGYNPGGEIGSVQERKKRGLEIRDYSAPQPTDEKGRNTLLFDGNADLVDFHAVISTAPDQIALAPGKLVREWEENGRRYFEYANKNKIQNFFNISSARYEVMEETYRGTDGRDIKLQIFHHPDHDANLDRFMAGLRDAIAYNSENFSPYQFDQMRLLEFPRYASFAQSFPNTVPYSESFGWVGEFSDPNDTDYAYYVTAHEIAHQWWGHQITPSATRGANQLSETMAQYSAMMVLKQRYGEAVMPKFLEYELNSYLRGRSGESQFEKTLLDNDSQSYVWYRKGSGIMYALQDYVGEDTLNAAMSRFIAEWGNREVGPYPTSLDWYGYLQSATPDSLRYFLRESFEEITLYENRARKATYEELADGKYRVTFDVETSKATYDGDGNEIGRPDERSLIEVGVFAADGTNDLGMEKKNPLFLEKRWLTPGTHTIEVIVDELPLEAGIDPYNKLIDRVSDDNLVSM